MHATHLQKKRILELKLKTLISGTKFRGDFESRIDTLQEFLKKNTDVILFINDIALITRIDGTSNIEEYFSELFSSDDINFIGTCTSDDYKKYIDDIAVIIQARLGSQRIPAKMLRPFAGTTLMDITIEKVLNSKVIPNDPRKGMQLARYRFDGRG